MWDFSSGDLYFWRSVPKEGEGVTLELWRLPSVGGDAEAVRDLTEYLHGELLAFDPAQYFMDGVAAVSPDGTEVSLLITSLEEGLSTPYIPGKF